MVRRKSTDKPHTTHGGGREATHTHTYTQREREREREREKTERDRARTRTHSLWRMEAWWLES